jgi:nucleotide-binding universal stress UspA family protein
VAELFLGSVSAGIVNHSTDSPIWLVGKERLSNGIMVAVDGSENSLKAVDHLAFIIEKNTDATISFFHVTPRLQDYCAIDFEETNTDALEAIIRQGDKACIDKFYAHAKKRLRESGIQESQIQVKVATGVFRVAKAVLEEYRQGDYGTLVIGRRGMNKKGFTGSVSRTIINQFSDGALWVVP